MRLLVVLLPLLAAAWRPAPRNLAGLRSRLPSLQMTTAPPGMKPMPDGTFKKAGEHLPQYVLEMDNGAKAIVRSYGGNCFSYITKDGIEVMGTRKDVVRDDSKPYAGGNPHCFPQVPIYRLLYMQYMN